MRYLNAKIGSAVAIASIVATVIAPVSLASTDIVVAQNGAKSDNTVKVNNTDKTIVNQSNETVVINDVKTSSNTGGNDANMNTGGDVTVKTGDTKTKVNVTTTGSVNKATLANSCGCEDDTTVTVEKNGAKSDNTVKLNNGSVKKVNQGNSTLVVNKVKTSSNTGGNDANKNTDGKTTVNTGNEKTKVNVTTTGSKNVLK